MTFAGRQMGSREQHGSEGQWLRRRVGVRAEGFVGKLLEFRGQALRIFFLRRAEDVRALEIGVRRVQEQDSIARPMVAAPKTTWTPALCAGSQKHLLGRGLGKKDGPIVLIDSLGGKTGAGLLPFDDLGVDGFQTVVFQALRGRAGGGDTTQRE